jgi:hypothetical protein
MKYESGCAGVSYGFLVVSTRQPWAGTARVGVLVAKGLIYTLSKQGTD